MLMLLCVGSVQEIFRDSLRSPELRLRVVKHRAGDGRAVNGVKKKPPPPIYPKPSINHPKHPLYNKENVAMVEGEEKSKHRIGVCRVMYEIF